MDADDVVLGFLEPPGRGKEGVALQSLFGFERVHVKAGETVSVFLYPQFSDFVHAGRDGKRSATGGQYRVRFGVQEAVQQGMGFAEGTLFAELQLEEFV